MRVKVDEDHDLFSKVSALTGEHPTNAWVHKRIVDNLDNVVYLGSSPSSSMGKTDLYYLRDTRECLMVGRDVYVKRMFGAMLEKQILRTNEPGQESSATTLFARLIRLKHVTEEDLHNYARADGTYPTKTPEIIEALIAAGLVAE